MAALNRWLRSLVGGREVSTLAAGTSVGLPTVAAGFRANSPVQVRSGDFRVGSKTDAGKVRDNNEDAVMVLTSHTDMVPAAPDFGLFMVADGMGGYQHGEAASALALRVSATHLVSQVYVSLLSGSERGANQPALTEVVREAVMLASRAVSDELPGSGCTLTCGMVMGGRLLVGHVGDSRAYVCRQDGTLVQLTRDHSYVNRLIEVGQLSAEDADRHPQRNVLYQAIGQPDPLEVEVLTRSLDGGERLLLCSDGLWNMVSEGDIAEMVGMADPQTAAEALVDAANTAGGTDNISVVLVELVVG